MTPFKNLSPEACALVLDLIGLQLLETPASESLLKSESRLKRYAVRSALAELEQENLIEIDERGRVKPAFKVTSLNTLKNGGQRFEIEFKVNN